MTHEEAEQKINEAFNGVTDAVSQYIEEEMVGMKADHLARYNAEIGRATDELQSQIEKQQVNIAFWLDRILTAKEHTRRK